MQNWNWQQKDWPKFTFDENALKPLEHSFLTHSGSFLGILKHTSQADQNLLKIGFIGSEAYKTSEIEGEILDRESLQSSIRRNFGLATDTKKLSKKNSKLAEEGIAQMMYDLYQNFAKPLTHKQLFSWHTMLMQGQKNLKIGAYRTHTEAMQVVSGSLHNPKIHFEAPPSKRMKKEMDRFIKWFNQSKNLSALTRAALAHFHFITIHPFEDSNGRIARALTIKAISQVLTQPSLISLSHVIQDKKKSYYSALERGNKTLKIDDWMNYFSQTILAAQKYSQNCVEFLIEKTKFFDRMRDQLNQRQEKVLNRIFSEGLEGFKGGLSAENYISISKTSRATATRDLQDLVEKKALTKTGTLKKTRYFLNLKTSACTHSELDK
jgi:Fic family protein